MRNLFVTFVATLAMVLLTSPAQADQVSVELQDVTLTSPCSNCEKTANITTALALPQGETMGIQSIDDHGWGGEGDDPGYNHWIDLWAFIMDVLYFYHLDII